MSNASQQIVNKAWSFAHVLRDKSLEASDTLPEPDVLAQEIADDLQTALERFAAMPGLEKARLPGACGCRMSSSRGNFPDKPRRQEI